MGHALLLIYAAVITLPAVMWQAYASVVLWGWFVTPTFSIEAPSLWIMAGLALFLSLQVTRTQPNEKPPHEVAVLMTLRVLITPATALAFGWVFKTLA
jgi:hypothetical protein